MTPTKAQPVVMQTTGGKTAANNRDGQPHHTTARPNSQPFLAQALRYALAGWRVLPLQPGGKAPLTAHGVHDASSDPETIGEWWQRWPAANIGLALDNAHVVLDVDLRHGGKLEDVYKLGVDVDATPVQRTWSGGWHVLLEKPVSMAFAGKVPGVPGIDVKTDGGYIVAAPSMIDGKPYRWERDPLDVDPVRIPLKLAERLTKRPAAARTGAQDGPTAAQPATPGQYDKATIKSMLEVLDPWAGRYDDYWLPCLLAVHNALGDDGLDIAEAWADGKPGEVAAKWETFKEEGNRKGKVTIATLAYHARAAGWEPPTAPTEADIPAAWRITADDWQTCPTCANLYVVEMTDKTTMAFHRWCRRPTCPVYRKMKARQALAVIFSWPAVQTETVPAAAWRTWRKHANRLHGDNWRAVPLAGGDRLALWSVDSGGVPVDDVLPVAVGAILESEQARRAHRGKVAEAKAFLAALPLDEELDPETWRKMQEALDLVASSKPGGNVSRPRRKRTDPAQEAQPPAPRAKPVDTFLVCSMRQRRAIFDVLNRLAIPWERRQYGGWRTDPLTPDQLAQLKTALVFGVPGARVLSGALTAGSYAELSTVQPAQPTGKIYLNAPQALVDAHRNGRKVPRLERQALE